MVGLAKWRHCFVSYKVRLEFMGSFVYKAQLWQTGVYLYLHTKPLPLSSICSHHLLKWRRLCIISRPRLQSKLQRCDWCCTWCCLATMMFMYPTLINLEFVTVCGDIQQSSKAHGLTYQILHCPFVCVFKCVHVGACVCVWVHV